MNELQQRLGKRIRDLRAAKGWSQEEFADVCGVHRTYMGHLERGEKNLSLRTMQRVTEALGVRLADLFAGIEEGTEPQMAFSPSGRAGRTGILQQLAIIESAIKAMKETALSSPSMRPNRSLRKNSKQPSARY